MDGEVTRIHLLNRERVRCCRFGGAARREEREYPSWIFDRRATPRQSQRSPTLRATSGRAAGVVAPQSQNASAMLLRRAWPFARQNFAQPFPIYEMGSKSTGNAAPCPTSAMRAQQMTAALWDSRPSPPDTRTAGRTSESVRWRTGLSKLKTESGN